MKDALTRLAASDKELADAVQTLIGSRTFTTMAATKENPPPAPAAASTTGATAKHPLNDYIPCLFTKEDVAFFRSGQTSVALRKFLQDELSIQKTIGRLTDYGEKHLYDLLQDKSPSQYDDVIDTAVAAPGSPPITKTNLDESLPAAVTAIKNALQSSMASPESFKVGCSQSILTYKETHDIYGHRIAETYIPIQVVVRNLDPDHEFMMHDVQIAVYSTRFIAGRDRVLARGVAAVGQSEDPRNRWIRIAETVGDLASAVSVPLTSRDFKNGVAVFRSGLIPGLKSIFPDYTIDQLNRMNDTAFSSSTSYRIVVPKNGSVPFVTFLPSDIYGDVRTSDGSSLAKSPFPKNYKRWDRAQLQWLQENTYVIFAGVHITEVDKSKASLGKMDCDTVDGHLDFGKAKDGKLTCKVTGDNLSALKSIRLKSSLDSADTVTADGALTVDKDEKTGTVAFKTDDLSKLRGAQYTAYLVSQGGQDTATSIEVRLAPVVSEVTPTTIKTANCKQCGTISLKGEHLDAIGGQISLVPSDQKSAIQANFAGPARDGSRSATFNDADLKSIKTKADYTLVITVDGKEVKTDKKVTLDPTGP